LLNAKNDVSYFNSTVHLRVKTPEKIGFDGFINKLKNRKPDYQKIILALLKTAHFLC